MGKLAEDMKNGKISQEQFNDSLTKLGPSMEKKLKDMNVAGQLSNEEFAKMGPILAQLNKSQKAVSDANTYAATEEGKNSASFTKAIMNIENAFNSLWGDLKLAFLKSDIFKKMADGATWVGEKLLSFKGPLTDFVKGISDGTNPLFQRLSSIINSVAIPAINFIGDILKNYVIPAFNKIVEVIKNSIDPTLNFLGKAFNIASNIITTYVVPSFNKIVEVIKSSIDPTLNFLGKAFNIASDIVTNYVVPAFSTIVNAIKNSIEPTLNFLGSAFRIAGDIVNNIVIPVFNGLVSIVKSVSGLIGAVLMPVINESTRVFTVITGVLGTVLRPVIDLVGSAFNRLFGGVSGGLTPAVGTVTGTIDTLTSVVKTVMPYLITLGEAFLVYKGIVLAVSGAKAAYVAVVTTLSSIQAAWAARTVVLTTVTTGLAAIQGILAGGMTILAGAVAFLTSPVTLVVGAIALLLASLKALYDSGWSLSTAWEAIKDNFSLVMLKMSKSISDTIDWIVSKTSFGIGGKSDAEKKADEAKYQAQLAEYAAREKARDEKREATRKERGTEDSVFNFSAKKEEVKKPEEQSLVPAGNAVALNDLAKNIQAGNLTQQQMAELFAQREKKLETLAPELAKAVNDSKKDQAVGISPDLNDTLKNTIKALDPSGKMSNEQLLKELTKANTAGAIGNEEFAKMGAVLTQLKTPTATAVPQPPRDYNQVRWEAEAKQMNSSNGGKKEVEVAGDRAVAQAKAEDEAKEAAANQVATLNTVSDGIGKLSGIMMAILDLQLQQVEAQKDLVNAAKGRYNVTS
jgi:hypothetical protein